MYIRRFYACLQVRGTGKEGTFHRMIWQKVVMSLTFREVAKNLNVALGTVYVFRQFKQTGAVDPRHPDRTSTRKLSSSEELIVITQVSI